MHKKGEKRSEERYNLHSPFLQAKLLNSDLCSINAVEEI